MRENTLSLGVFCDHPSLAKRLANEFLEAGREFKKNPKQFLTSIIKGDTGGGPRRKALFRFGLAMGILIYAIAFVAVLILWTMNAKPNAAAYGKNEFIITIPPPRPLSIPLPESDRQAGGGGGGGREMMTPATYGQRPPFYLDHPIIAPTTRPQLKPPVLTVSEWLLGDPSHNVPRDALLPTGIPDGVIAPPSDGPGSNGGIGTGKDGGIGSGEKAGFGPGERGGQGGDTYTIGGRRGGNNAVDQVDSKPIPLNRPRPNYTEEARKEKLQGTVRAQVLVGEDGRVERVKVIRGMRAGLTEEAIKAAMQMRFRPATKDGHPVAHWVTMDIEFNLR